MAPSSRRPSSYLHGFCAMIPHRGKLFLVKRRSLVRRLSASKPSFVAPTGLRHLPRLRPKPRLNLYPRRARYGFRYLYRSPPFGLVHYYPRAVRGSTSQRSSAFRHRSSPTHAFVNFLALVSFFTSPPSVGGSLFHFDLFSRCLRPTPVLTLPPSSQSTMSSASYRSSSVTSTPAPLPRRVPQTPVHCLPPPF